LADQVRLRTSGRVSLLGIVEFPTARIRSVRNVQLKTAPTNLWALHSHNILLDAHRRDSPNVATFANLVLEFPRH